MGNISQKMLNIYESMNVMKKYIKYKQSILNGDEYFCI